MNKKDIFSTRSNVIEYTSGQVEALKKVEIFLNSKDNFFLLAGFSGTGKTTIAENIIGYKKGFIAAPTNAAVNRLKDKISMPYEDASTIHKILFSPKDEKGNFRKDKSFKFKSLYILDECSMIDAYILKVIIKDAVEKNCKIIFMGDSFQLEPVGENPCIFKWEEIEPDHFFEHNKYELTEVRRYDGDLLKLATEMRERKEATFTQIETDEFTEVNKFSKNLIKDLVNNRNFIVLTSTNSNRIMYNTKLREYKYRNSDLELKYVQDNDCLVSVSNSTEYSNGETFKAVGMTLIDEFEINMLIKESDEDYKPYRCLLYRRRILVKLKPVTQMVMVIPELLEPSFQTGLLLHSIKNQNTILSSTVKGILIIEWFNKFLGIHKQLFNKDVVIATYGYAISGHKAQGQEWDNVYIDGQWLMPVWDPAKWYYTAITRAKSKVEVRLNKYLTILPKED